MVVECLAILVILLMTSFVFLRAHKVDYAALTAILLVVPAVHLLGELFGSALAQMLSVREVPFRVALDMVAVVVSCVMLGFGCNKLPAGKQRKGFLLLASAYSILLTWIFIFNLVI